MNKIYLPLSLALAAFSLASCGDDKNKFEPDKPTVGDGVEVTISTSEIETKAAMLEFSSNDRMNIYPKTDSKVDANNLYDDVVASFDGAKWKMEPAVMLDDKNTLTFIYAVAPYDAAYTDPAAIPVDLNKQVDLLYSGTAVPASRNTPTVQLRMKHALALATFNIVPSNFTGAGKLQSAKMQGDIVYRTGTMKASTGKLTAGEKGEINAKYDRTVEAGGWKSDIPGMWVMPFNTKTGTANIDFNIDGKTYSLTLPEVEMRQGYQYIFRLVLTDNGLEFDPSKTETLSLNVTTDEPQEFQGYGRLAITASGNWMLAPAFLGDAVFGTISSPAQSMPYSPAFRLENLSAGQTVVVESWNSTGFELETLDGVESIDMSKFE